MEDEAEASDSESDADEIKPAGTSAAKEAERQAELAAAKAREAGN